MTTSSGPAPGGPWAGRASRGRRLRSRPRRPAWPLPAHPKEPSRWVIRDPARGGRQPRGPGGLGWRGAGGEGQSHPGARPGRWLPRGSPAGVDGSGTAGTRSGLGAPARDRRARGCWDSAWRRLGLLVATVNAGRSSSGGEIQIPRAPLELLRQPRSPLGSGEAGGPRPFPFSAPGRPGPRPRRASAPHRAGLGAPWGNAERNGQPVALLSSGHAPGSARSRWLRDSFIEARSEGRAGRMPRGNALLREPDVETCD